VEHLLSLHQPPGLLAGRYLSTHSRCSCQLCLHQTVYQSHGRLSDHATIHHGCWYSARGDIFVPTPKEKLLAKRQKVRDGQVHRHHCVDPHGAAMKVVGCSLMGVELPEKPPSKHGQCLYKAKAQVAPVLVPVMPSTAPPSQNTCLCASQKQRVRQVQAGFIPPGSCHCMSPPPVPMEDQSFASEQVEASTRCLASP